MLSCSHCDQCDIFPHTVDTYNHELLQYGQCLYILAPFDLADISLVDPIWWTTQLEGVSTLRYVLLYMMLLWIHL